MQANRFCLDLGSGNIVQTYFIGNAKIHICDDLLAKTPEEIEKVKTEFRAAGWKIVNNFIQEDKDI